LRIAIVKDPLVPEARYGAARLFAVGLVLVILAPLFWMLTEQRSAQGPDGYENADLYQRIYPTFDFAFGRLREGSLPLWNSQQMCGTPLHTDPRLGLWSPLNIPFLGLETGRGLAVNAYLCLALMGFGTTLTLRALGAGYIAALFGGIVFAFSGAAAGVMSRPGEAGTLAWAPWLIWAAVEHGNRFRFSSSLPVALILGLMGVSGSYGLAVVFGAFAMALLLYLSFFPLGYGVPGLGRRLATLLAVPLLAAGLSAVQWLPALLWAIRSEGVADAIWNLRPAALAPVILRDLASHLLITTPSSLPRLAYIGIAALPLIPVALLHRDARRVVIFLVLTLPVVWLLWVIGKDGMPFQFPANGFIFVATMCAALLAALGFDRLFLATERRGFILHAPPVLLALTGVVLLFFVVPGGARGYLMSLAAAIFIFFLLRRRWAAAACGLAIAVLQFIDLSAANTNRFRHPFMNAPACYQRYSDALDTAREQALGARALVSATPLDWGLVGNIGMVASLRTVNGYAMPMSYEQALWWQALTGGNGEFVWPDATAITPGAQQPALLNYMAARAFVVAPDGPMAAGQWAGPGPPLREVRTEGEGRVLVNDQALPRAYWTPGVRIAADPREAITMLSDSDFDADRLCVIDRSTPGVQRLGGEITALEQQGETLPALTRADGACQVEEISPERITIRVTAPELGVVVLADTYAPGWTATVDGAGQVILRANGIFRAVPVPPGEHVVTFVYRPVPFYAGATVTALTLTIFAIFAVLSMGRLFFGPSAKPPQSKRPAMTPAKETSSIQPFKRED
jgi:hypothetical protein